MNWTSLRWLSQKVRVFKKPKTLQMDPKITRSKERQEIQNVIHLYITSLIERMSIVILILVLGRIGRSVRIRQPKFYGTTFGVSLWVEPKSCDKYKIHKVTSFLPEPITETRFSKAGEALCVQYFPCSRTWQLAFLGRFLLHTS